MVGPAFLARAAWLRRGVPDRVAPVGDSERHTLLRSFPAIVLIAPALGEAAGGYLLGCLLAGAVLALWSVRRSRAIVWMMAWALATSAFAGIVLLVPVYDIPSLTVLTFVTAAVQAIALLGVAAPATIAGWAARRMALLALAGPAALALLATGVAAGMEVWALAAAIALNLSGPPLALTARRWAAR